MNRFLLVPIVLMTIAPLAIAQDNFPATHQSKQSIAGAKGPYGPQGERNIAADPSGAAPTVDAAPEILQDKQSIAGPEGPYDEQGELNARFDPSGEQDHPIDEVIPSTHQSKSSYTQQ
ncbi:MAG: hypothetical protein R3310_03840 [Candidatus Competibacteraceae bacterium]|nr:hypothetical protein [Candidatus Competibacteraceae bacterium]